MRRAAVLLLVLAACGQPADPQHLPDSGTTGSHDDAPTGGSGDDGGNSGPGDDGGLGDGGGTSGDGGSSGDGGFADGGGTVGDGGIGDGGVGDGGMADGGGGMDAGGMDAGGMDAGGMDAGGMDAPAGIIDGGPCMSGAAGATAFRVRWANGGGTAYPVYEVNGLPDPTPDHVAALGYQIGFTPSYVDPYLAQGGVQLDGSDFIDIDLSTVGVSSITATKLSIYGRSFNTTASGSFSWQTLYDIDATPSNFVSNGAPYEWYTADMTPAVPANTDNIKIRIKAGPSSGSLVVNRIEICMQAN